MPAIMHSFNPTWTPNSITRLCVTDLLLRASRS